MSYILNDLPLRKVFRAQEGGGPSDVLRSGHIQRMRSFLTRDRQGGHLPPKGGDFATGL